MALSNFQRTIVDDAGNVIPNATVTVRVNDSSGALADLFTDRAGTSPASNPISADGEGFVRFYVAGGRYYIKAEGASAEIEWEDYLIGTMQGQDSDDVDITGGDIDANLAYDNTDSGLDADNVQDAIDESAEKLGLSLIQDGIDPAVARAVAYNDIGAPVAGGYFAGVIDTVKGTIQGNDDYQTGERYALIVAPKELEGGRDSSPAPGLTTGDLEWDTTRGGGEAGTFTRWNGLSATDVIIAKNEAKYEVHNFIKECRDLYPAPATAGGSNWYLPALDELELLYRNFKPNYEDNDTRNFPRNFPGSQPSGTNPSSDPTSPVNANNPRRPEKTPVLGFRENEAAAVDLERYWSTTDANEDGRAWRQNFTRSENEGGHGAANKDNTDFSVRPVRRVAL